MVYLLEGYITVVIEMMIFKIFVDTFFKPKSKSPYRTIGIFFLVTVLCAVISALLEKYLLFKIPAVSVTMFFCMLFYAKGHWGQIAVLTLSYQGMLLVTDFIALGLKNIFFPDADISYGANVLLITFLARMALFLFVIVLQRIFSRREFGILEDKDWIKFIFFPLFTICMIMAMFSRKTLGFTEHVNELLVVMSIGLVMMNLVMFYLLDDILKKQTELRNQQIFMLETQNQLKLYESLSQSVKKQRQMSHEYQNQLNIIQMLSEKNENEELKKYLAQINGELLHDMDYIDTHHVIVNAVLNQKYSECRSKGILFVCKINDMSALQMENQDIATVLSNLLGNAIEACEKLTDKKIIKVKCVLEDHRLYLSVKNTFDGQIHKEGDSFVTRKKKDRDYHPNLPKILYIGHITKSIQLP